MKKSIWKLASLFAAVLALSLCFAGCSSDDDDGGSFGGTTTGGTTTGGTTTGDSSSVRAALVGKYYAFNPEADEPGTWVHTPVAAYFTLTDKDTCVVKTSNTPTTTPTTDDNGYSILIYNYGDSWTGSFTLTFNEEKSSAKTLKFTNGDEYVYFYSSSGNFTKAEGDIEVASIRLKSPIKGHNYISIGGQAYYYGESEPMPNQAAKACGQKVSE